MSQFWLFRRGNIWYVRVYNPQTRKYLKVSTGQTDRQEAEFTMLEWKRDGIPQDGAGRKIEEVASVKTFLNLIKTLPLTSKDARSILRVLNDRDLIKNVVIPAENDGGELLGNFLLDFWDYDKSLYVREKKANGKSIGRRHCYDSKNQVKNYWVPYFEGKLFSEVTRIDVKKFLLWLAEENN